MHPSTRRRLDGDFVQGRALGSAPAAQRMSWMSQRSVSRGEDIAYCMLGLFNINMTLLYGEGEWKAFSRLQRKILKQDDDRSLFEFQRDEYASGLLAQSPSQFLRWGEGHPSWLDPANWDLSLYSMPVAWTSRGVHLHVAAYKIAYTSKTYPRLRHGWLIPNGNDGPTLLLSLIGNDDTYRTRQVIQGQNRPWDVHVQTNWGEATLTSDIQIYRWQEGSHWPISLQGIAQRSRLSDISFATWESIIGSTVVHEFFVRDVENVP